MTFDPSEAVLRYHRETKHHYHRYARSLGHMDWGNQPDPFRTYSGGEPVFLPLLDRDPDAGYTALYRRTGNRPQALSLSSIAAFFELSLALSAWKEIPGNRWALRINPSSGNLHPTEAHVVIPDADGIVSGVYHYNPLYHVLEPRARISRRLCERIERHMGRAGFLLGLTSIFWRESWKYGERAYRYCNHDVGHALAAVSMSANLQGWRVVCLNALSDGQVKAVLGLARTEWHPLEEEHPDVICFVCAGDDPNIPRFIPESIIAGFDALDWFGKPNRLSREHVNWEIIYHTARNAEKPVTTERRVDFQDLPFRSTGSASLPAAAIIRKRRSAVAFTPRGSIPRDVFMGMLDKTLPRKYCAPFDMELSDPAVNLLLFVHGVEGLSQGMYFFLRTGEDLQTIRRLAASDLLWKPVEPDFPLYCLKLGDFRNEATQVSCHQEIAGMSAFSLGMIARFGQTVRQAPYRYRYLFWETGMIGQVLYLEAEAHGFRGTGIGCFFDDPVHAMIGLTGEACQSLYHFTVGTAVEDRRLLTRPPYFHLRRH